MIDHEKTRAKLQDFRRDMICRIMEPLASRIRADSERGPLIIESTVPGIGIQEALLGLCELLRLDPVIVRSAYFPDDANLESEIESLFSSVIDDERAIILDEWNVNPAASARILKVLIARSSPGQPIIIRALNPSNSEETFDQVRAALEGTPVVNDVALVTITPPDFLTAEIRLRFPSFA